MPFYKGLGDNFPRAYQIATSKIDDDSIFWMFRKLQTLVMQDYPKIAPGVKKAICEFEEKIREDQKKMESEYLVCFNEGDTDSAKKCIIDYTTRWVDDEISFLKEQIKKCNSEYNFDNETFYKKAVEIEKRYHFGADVPSEVSATLRLDDAYTNLF